MDCVLEKSFFTYIYMWKCGALFFKAWSPNFALEHRSLDWRLSCFGKELFKYIRSIAIISLIFRWIGMTCLTLCCICNFGDIWVHQTRDIRGFCNSRFYFINLITHSMHKSTNLDLTYTPVYDNLIYMIKSRQPSCFQKWDTSIGYSHSHDSSL